MRRSLVALLCLSVFAPASLAANLSDYQLNRTLTQVAKRSSEGTPRAINEFITDQGYAVEDIMLINYLSVEPQHGQQMQLNRHSMREQLRSSVCSNQGFRELLNQGAVLSYRFSEQHSNRPLIEERFTAIDCQL